MNTMEDRLPSQMLVCVGASKEEILELAGKIVADRDRAIGQTHPDIHYYTPEEGGYPISLLKQIQEQVHTFPYEGHFRVLILEQGEKISPLASQTLLKLCEEPPDHLYILIMVENEKGLLPTLRARLYPYFFSSKEIQEDVSRFQAGFIYATEGRWSCVFEEIKKLEQEPHLDLWFEAYLGWLLNCVEPSLFFSFVEEVEQAKQALLLHIKPASVLLALLTLLHCQVQHVRFSKMSLP